MSAVLSLLTWLFAVGLMVYGAMVRQPVWLAVGWAMLTTVYARQILDKLNE